jgi:phosphate transport system substrate-binding protein
VAPTPAGATAAIEAFRSELENDMRTPIVDPPATAKDAYPISGLTFLLVPKQGRNPAKQAIVKQFVQFIITEGQSSAEALEYSRLPESLAQQVQKMLGEIGSGQQASGNMPTE